MIVQPLTGKQRLAVQLSRRHRIAVYEGSVRSAKTISSLLDWLQFVREAPPGPLLMVGKTERTLERNIIGPLIDMLGARRCKLTRGTGELHLLGRTVLVVGANDERAQEKIRGLTLAGAYVDEASLVPESFWQMLLTRLSVAGARLIATTNPDSPQHWLKKDNLERGHTWLKKDGTVVDHGGPVDLVRLSFHLRDNPTLDPSYLAFLQASYVGLWRRRFIDGDWVAAEGAVYDMLDLEGPAAAHRMQLAAVRREFTGRWWVGVDYGQSNPFHAVLLASSVTDRLIVCGEWRYDGRTSHRQLDDGEYETRLRGWLENGGDLPDTTDVWPDRTAVDPSAASFRSMLRNRGWTGLTSADNAVSDGIRNTSSLLAARRLLFAAHDDGTPCAPELEREMTGYVWDPKATKRGEDEPLKVHDHGPDALRYDVQACKSTWRPWLSHLAVAA